MLFNVASFVGLPVLFFKIIGITPFQATVNGRLEPISRWRTFNLVAAFTNLGLCVIGEMIYFAMSLTSGAEFDLIGSVEVFLCIGFIVMSYVKLATILWFRTRFNLIISELDDMFPKTDVENMDYRTEFYVNKAGRIMRSYAWIQMVMIWLYNMYALAQSTYAYWTMGVWEVDLPYVIWYPFNEYARGWFEFHYASQIWAGFVSAAAILSADLMLCAVAVQICMHFDHLTKRLRRMRAQGGQWARHEFDELKSCVRVHYRVIQMSEDLDDIFGVCILFNVASSVLILCVVGFLLMVTDDLTALIKFTLTLIWSSVQIYLIALLGDMFIESSTEVGNGAWEGEWFSGDWHYRKAILMIIGRAQRPLELKAFKYAVASMELFTNVMTTSWRFFAFIQTMFDES